MSAAEFDGLSVLVTGGASGIGRATATMFARTGARVAVMDLTVDGLDADVVGFQADIANEESVIRAVGAAASHLGGLDILVNNAGIGAQGTVEDVSDEEWARVLSVNVTGVARVSAAALPFLRRSKHPSIVNTCSVAASVGLPQRALYSASKGAVLALTRAMATDHVAEGIRVNSVSPGTADTPWVARLLEQADDPETERESLAGRQAMGRLVQADEVAHAILFLAGPRSGSTTGVDLLVDGGLTHLRVRK
ncbi:SDR family NAD(P)-dependent oxidoreductase [Plantibacter sp. YIM 135347]|uniref:SDR family NAD(P)-dependent oxidoreductase n=1 Tax=Plantibacter sp. YIM 135347 TaxID=3423919 RepID=UPI003D34B107